ncbi:HNH endonuclease [Lactococcus phage CB13]|uniref:Putative HNH endonuclease n=1 Tax=Lactococcus phage CB13 TaxID=2898541 RepID=C7T218_9CAUD|nr:HNH endonuclease [Lactococcus phage CB13]ACU46844.1 putative HNH endonuclease [Lactococcus phage CB13]
MILNAGKGKMEYKKIYNLIVFENGTIYREFKTKCKLIKPIAGSHGYCTIRINGNNMLVHRLIMEAFRGKSDLTVDHIDGNKLNNSLDNLEYVTLGENIKRAYYKGLRETALLSLSKPVRFNNKTYKSATELSKKLGRCESYVSQKIKRNKPINGFKVEFI